MTDDVSRFFKDDNFVALLSLLEEVKASPDRLKGLDSEQKQQLSQTIKDAIWQKMPQLGKIKDNPGNIECYYWIGTLFSWDWSRIELLSSFDERMKGLTAFAYDPKDGPLVKGYPNIITYFMQRYIALGGTEHRTEARQVTGGEDPPDECSRLRESERLIPFASKDNPVPDVEVLKGLLKRRADLQTEVQTAFDKSMIDKTCFDELTCLNRLHGLGVNDISQVPGPLRSLFDDCLPKGN
jgi:hypothetical protein